MKSLWTRIIGWIVNFLGLSTAPPEVIGSDFNLDYWWSIYRCKAPWLVYHYVDASGVRRRRDRKTLNVAKILVSEMAGLVLAENPKVEAGKLVESVLEEERFWDNLRKSLEYQGALGGQALKILINKDQAGKVELCIDFVKAHNFIPLAWDNRKITEAAFLDRRVKGKNNYVRVETHRLNDVGGYTITNKAYNSETGQEISLAEFSDEVIDETADIAIGEPLFVYIRNPEANNIDPESPLGISLFANALDTLETLDLAFDGMKTEFLMGRQRVALPGNVMRGYVDTDGIRRVGFDATDEAYIRLDTDEEDKFKPTDLSGQLRMEQYRKGIQTLLDLLAVQTGFSAGYFSFDGTSVKTATEVISDNSKTYKTMQAYRAEVDVALKQLFTAINLVGKLYSVQGADAASTVTIAWNDSVIESRDARATYWQGLIQNKLTDRVTALMAVHGISAEDAAVMAAKIDKENTVVLQDPFSPPAAQEGA